MRGAGNSMPYLWDSCHAVLELELLVLSGTRSTRSKMFVSYVVIDNLFVYNLVPNVRRMF